MRSLIEAIHRAPRVDRSFRLSEVRTMAIRLGDSADLDHAHAGLNIQEAEFSDNGVPPAGKIPPVLETMLSRATIEDVKLLQY